jgi:phage shock protein B
MNSLMTLSTLAAVHPGEILIVLIVIGLPIICGTIILLVLLARRGGRSKEKIHVNEARLIQELHQGLNRLENRIESLETILIETERNKERTP